MKWGNYHEVFFPQHFGRNKSEIWIWGTKIDVATDIQPTAQQVKLGFNLLSMLLIHHKYIDQVGKALRRCFPVAFSVKKIEMRIWGTKIDIL